MSITTKRRIHSGARVALCAALIALALLLAGALPFAAGAAKKGEGYNVVVILNDALCASHLACYGYGRNTSRVVDRLAREGALFENCLSQAWYTLPSHASLFTSRYVHTHKVTKNTNRLAPGETTLAGVLKANGYRTAAFTGGIFLEPVYGLNQGFDTYYSSTAERTAQQPELFPLRLGKSEFIVPKAMTWLEENRSERFFLFVHFYDLFLPARSPAGIRNRYDPRYRGPADALLALRQLHLQKTSRNTWFVGKKKGRRLKEIRLAPRDTAHIVANYDEAIFYSDLMIGKLLEKLDRLDLTRKTLIVFTSDHGTDLLGHGTLHLYMDGSVYDEVLHVPLIMKCPGVSPGSARIAAQVQLIDVMPTILDILGIPGAAGAEGKSLLPLLREGSRGEPGGVAFGGWDAMQTVRAGRWKLVYTNGSFALYDLAQDPGETTNLADAKPEILLGLLEKLLSWSSRAPAGGDGNRIRMDRTLREKLRKAGYW